MRHRDGAIPVDGHESPCQGSGDDGGVDEARIGVVAEGKGGEVVEVDDQDDLSPGEVSAGEEHNEGEVKEIVQDKVRAYSGGSVDLLEVTGEEVENITDLQDEQDHADLWSEECHLLEGGWNVYSQVNGDKREVEGEAGQVEKVLAWDSAAVLEIIGGRLDRIIG